MTTGEINHDIAYQGKRNPSTGRCEVQRKNGTDLPPCNDIYNHSPDGFNWGYGGSGPSQLALAITVDRLGADNPKIWDVYHDFKEEFIAPIQGDRLMLTEKEMSDYFAEL